MRGAQAVVTLLRELGVEVVFGLCGDTTLPLYEALYDLASGDDGEAGPRAIRHVLTRDERSASFMADAYSRLSGKVGVCEGPSGGGATYILPGVAEANASSVPLVCLTTDIDASDVGRGTLTELDQGGLFRAVARSTCFPGRAQDIPRALRAAFRQATTGSLGAAHVGLSYNVQTATLDPGEVHIDSSLNRYPSSRTAPDPRAVKDAARLLTQARHPLVVAGAGVLRSAAWDELAALARLLGAPVATSISGKGSLAETDPYALGVVGSNGGLEYRHEVLRQADTVFYVGCRQGSVTTEKWQLPKDGDKTLVQLDVDPHRMGHNYRTEVGMVADAKLGLAAVVEEVSDLLAGRPGERWDPQDLARRRDAGLAEIEELSSSETPIRPERFVAELSQVLSARTVVCADPGTPCPYLSAYYRIPQAGRWFVTPRAHGALGYSLPAVCGAYYARPDASRVVGVMGDGSFGISAGELETLVRLNLPVTLVVLNNAGYGWIKAGQRLLGKKYYSVDFSPSDHSRIARAYGMRGLRVERPEDLRPALEEGLTSPGPALVDVVVQPLEESRAPVSKWVA